MCWSFETLDFSYNKLEQLPEHIPFAIYKKLEKNEFPKQLNYELLVM